MRAANLDYNLDSLAGSYHSTLLIIPEKGAKAEDVLTRNLNAAVSEYKERINKAGNDEEDQNITRTLWSRFDRAREILGNEFVNNFIDNDSFLSSDDELFHESWTPGERRGFFIGD